MRWMIGTNGKRESGKSMLAGWHDDDDDDDDGIYICVCVCIILDSIYLVNPQVIQ